MNKLNKIGIVTLHGYYNYGNKLQNFALKYLLEKKGYQVSTTVITQPSKSITEKINNLSKTKILKFLSSKLNVNKRINNKKNQPLITERIKYFKDFSAKYLSEEFYALDNPNDLKKLDAFSFFIAGSDQVWNPIYYSVLPTYFLTFTEKRKRIAYAPSISRNKLPLEYQSSYKKWLEGMNSLSVREDAGAKIIKELTGEDVPVLVDPTLLLTKKEWLSVSQPASNRPDAPYLLTYFLGGPTNELQVKLKKIAQENGMTIINLGDIDERETYKTGPSEFLDYVNNASAFFTDSFHGVVFSIIFQTPFVVYERIYAGESMYSRIETILDNFDMRNRQASEFDGNIFSMDFSGTHELLEKEYENSLNYLKKSLEG